MAKTNALDLKNGRLKFSTDIKDSVIKSDIIFICVGTPISKKNKSLLCVGLDPPPAQVPVIDIFEFNKANIESTQHLVCAYKPNMGFYEAIGIDGLRALEKTVSVIPADIPVVGDAKRGDIGSTAEAYASALYDYWGFDAITCNPFAGYDSVTPFLRDGKGVFFWCRSSNPGARDFQDVIVSSPDSGPGLSLIHI